MNIFKKIIVIATLFIAGIFLLPSISQAGIGNNMFGNAWSDNIGWISFNNCTKPDVTTCTGYDYGANYVGAIWGGYAWSDNIGWISFNPSDWGACPPQGSCSSYATYNNSATNTWVWGRALNGVGNLDTETGGDYYDGWIAIYGNDGNGNNFGPTVSSPYTASSGSLSGFYVRDIKYTSVSGSRTAGSGYAWGGAIIGWIDLAIDKFGNTTELYAFVPKLMLTASPQTVSSGNTSTTLSWSSPDGTTYSSCVGLGGGSDWNNTTQNAITSVNPIRTKTNVSVPNSPTLFKITCTTATGVTATAETSVTLQNISSLNNITITASPTVVSNGGTTKLSWYSPTGTAFTGSCTASGGGTDWNGTQSQPTTGAPTRSKSNVSVPTTPKTTFKITCPIANGGTVSNTVDVYVNSSSSNLIIVSDPLISVVGGKIKLTYNSPSNTAYTSCTSLGGGSDWDNVTQTALSAGNSYTKAVSNITVPQPNPPVGFVMYGIECQTSSGITDTAFTPVYVTSAPSSLLLTASPTTVPSGSTTNLYWYSPSGSSFTSCTAGGGGTDWNGQTLSVPTTTTPNPAMYGVSVPNAKTIYTISCIDTGGATQTASAMVVQGTTKLTLTANPTSVSSGGTTTLTWAATAGTAYSDCVGTGGDSNWNKSQGVLSGGTQKSIASVGVPTYPKTTYFLTCTINGTSNTEVASAEVTITHTLKVNMSASPAVILPGDSSTVTWSVDNATASTSCSAGTPSGWTSSTSVTGSQQVNNIATSKTYTLNCSDSYTGATASGSVTVGILSIDSFSKSGTCINQGIDARLNWTSTNATACIVRYYSGGYTGGGGGFGLSVAPDKTFSASSTASNYVTTGAGVGDFTLTCYNGATSTPESEMYVVSVTQCAPRFSVSSLTTCASSTAQSFYQAVPPNGNYRATTTFVAVPSNGFNSTISLSIPSNGYGGIPSSALSWTSSTVSLSNGSYKKNLSINLTKSQYNTWINSVTNKYNTIKIQGTGTQSGTTTTQTGSYGICGPGGSSPVPVFRPI